MPLRIRAILLLLNIRVIINGEPVKEVVAESYPVELGNAMLMPEFEKDLSV